MSLRARARVLIVGAGGIGSPVALTLARAGVGTLGLVDDDRVERTNLHRQILFTDGDVGRDKLDAAARGLARLGCDARLELHRARLVPDNALELVRRYDLVVEGADNFSTKFLVADACRIAERPVIHGAAIRTIGTVLAVGGRGQPCYRCVFEDLSSEAAQNCETGGVLGPLVGLVAAVAADLALAAIDHAPRSGELVTVEAPARIRRRAIAPRPSCALCGDGAKPIIEEARYVPRACEA